MLDTKSHVPLYFQLESLVEKQIREGILRPGEKILSENELCKKYQISRTTARQAVQELVRVGLLVRTQGLGTFVADHHVQKPVEQLEGLTQDLMQQGKLPKSTVLQFSTIIPPVDVSRALLLNPNDAAIIIKRLRLADNEALCVDAVYLPYDRFNTILNYDMETSSLYAILQEEFGTIPTRSINTIQVIALDADIAELLEVQKGAPALFMIEHVFDQRGHIFEYCVSYFRGDRYQYHVEVNKFLSTSKLQSKLIEN